MKIYGQSLHEVFLRLPWAYKVVAAVGSGFLLFVLIYIPAYIFSPLRSSVSVEALRITPIGPLPSGIFDPSLAYDQKNGRALVAYAAAAGNLIDVRIAKASGKECKSWMQTAGGFEAKSDDILAPDGQSVFRSGVWRIETPALVYDPDDPGREWKLYAYKYFWPDDPASRLSVAQHYGMIVYKYAPDSGAKVNAPDSGAKVNAPDSGAKVNAPDSGAKEIAWSAEQWLFSPAADYPPPPYEQMVLLKLNGLDPSLRDVTSYARPSAVYKDGAIIMTLSSFTGGATPSRVVMIVSLDHGNSWRYVGAPLTESDLATLGPYTKLAGASLVEQAGRVYLAVVPGGDARRGMGTLVFGFEDLAKAALVRDPKTGVPVVLNRLPLQSAAPGKLGGGFAAYNDACSFGLLVSEQTADGSGFQILKTHKKPVAQ